MVAVKCAIAFPIMQRHPQQFLDYVDRVYIWIGNLCALLRHVDPRTVDGVVLEKLRLELQDQSAVGFLKEMMCQKDEAAANIVGLISAGVDLTTAGVRPIGGAGVLAAVYPLGNGLLKQFGFAPLSFDGPQWPFLYTYGKSANKRWFEEMTYRLGEPSP
jgi:hypothetical protein